MKIREYWLEEPVVDMGIILKCNLRHGVVGCGTDSTTRTVGKNSLAGFSEYNKDASRYIKEEYSSPDK
jgi:hypothetical protein